MGNQPKLMRVLAGEALQPPPIWIMRQAGRYLPEYRETRLKAGSFLDLCYTPELAAEVTMQPIRRFDFDAAILFSDILVVPDALGQHVRFLEGRGPVLEPLGVRLPDFDPAKPLDRLAPVLETVRLVRKTLSADKALIGFCGAPWTVATYMIAGQGSPDQAAARRLAFEDPGRLDAIIGILVEVSARYLIAQIKAGADVVKIFDSWAGILDGDGFERWAMAPVADLVDRVRAAAPSARIIVFPKGAGARLGRYAASVRADAIAVDWTVPMKMAQNLVGETAVLQGNLDPLRLVAGGMALRDGVDAVRKAMHGRPFIFNLGHGIVPETPVEHVHELISRVRGLPA